MKRRTAILLLALTGAASAQSLDLSPVLPARLATVEGNSDTNVVWRRPAPMRAMYCYGSDACDQRRPLRIRALGLRGNASLAGMNTTTWDFSLDVSTANRSRAADLSMVFDDNHGADRARVFDGPLTLTGQPFGVAPHEFVLIVPFDQPFTWNPRAPLLLDFRLRSTAGTGLVADATTDGSEDYGRLYHTTDADATTSEIAVERRGLVVELILATDVLPADRAGVDASTGSVTPWQQAENTGVRLQTVYDAQTFAQPHRRLQISRLGWRLNHGTVPYAARTYDLRVTLSTGASGLSASMSQTFAANHGADRRVVFDGTWSPPDIRVSPLVDPAPFALELPLQRTFEFDPRAGSLVVDIQVRNATGTPTAAGFDVHSQVGAGFAHIFHLSDPRAAQAQSAPDARGLVMALGGALAPTLPAVTARGDGTTFEDRPFTTPSRMLCAYDGSALGQSEPLFVNALSWRPEPGTPVVAGPGSISRVQVSLSTGPHPAGALVASFNANHGADRQVVYTGPLSVAQTVAGGVDDFVVAVALDRPFRWDPAQGPLVVDVNGTSTTGLGTLLLDAHGDAGLARIAHRSNPFANTADTGPDPQALVLRIAGPPCNASAVPIGAGCPGTNGVPVAATAGLPEVPNHEFAFTLRGARAQTAGALLIGLTSSDLALGFLGFVGCTLLTPGDLAVLPVTTLPDGSARRPLAIRDDPSFDGALLNTQWALLDPAGGGGLAMTGRMGAVFCR